MGHCASRTFATHSTLYEGVDKSMHIIGKVRVALGALVLASSILGTTVIPTSAQTVPLAQPGQPPVQPTSITLKSSTPWETAGSYIALSGVVSPIASGAVVIYDENNNELGRTFVSFRGTYQLMIGGANGLPVGVHTLTAVYGGNATFGGSSSAPITEFVYPHW